MSKGESIKLSTTFLVLFTQSFIIATNWLSWLLHGMGKVWQSKFEWEKPSVFGKHDFDLWGKLFPKIAAHSLLHPCCCLPHIFGAPSILHSRFLQCSSFFPWLGSVFVNVPWLGSLVGIFLLFPHLHGWGILCLQCCTANGGQIHKFRG